MAWYNKNGRDTDVVISSRVRLARNVTGIPFDGNMSVEHYQKIIALANEVFENAAGFTRIDFDKLSDVQRSAMVERHTVSPEFSSKKTPRALFCAANTDISVMVGEEDHIRIQSIKRGLDLEGAFRDACAADDLLDEKIDFAFSEKYGYLTKCPTNLGTGMRASVMVSLPCLTKSGRIAGIIRNVSKYGICVRGFFGEGSRAVADIYQISNDISLGLTEEDIIKRTLDVTRQIIEAERKLQKEMANEHAVHIMDAAGRAAGILSGAYIMSFDEFSKHYRDLRLGISTKLFCKTDLDAIDALFIELMPSSLVIDSHLSNDCSSLERDTRRAELLRAALIK